MIGGMLSGAVAPDSHQVAFMFRIYHPQPQNDLSAVVAGLAGRLDIPVQ